MRQPVGPIAHQSRAGIESAGDDRGLASPSLNTNPEPAPGAAARSFRPAGGTVPIGPPPPHHTRGARSSSRGLRAGGSEVTVQPEEPRNRSDCREGESTPQSRRRLTSALLLQAAKSADGKARHRILDEVVQLNMPVARSIAARHRNRSVPEEDLEQVAYLGLIQAERRFDASQGHDFLSFAVPTMRGEIMKYFRDHGWTVRPPRRVREIQGRINHEGPSLTQRLGRDPTLAELANALREEQEAVGEAITASRCFRPDSLDRPVAAGSSITVGDLLDGSDATGYEAAEVRAMLEPSLRKLSARDRQILRLCYVDGRSQQEIANDLGTSQPQVSRAIARIVRGIRSDLHIVPTAHAIGSDHGSALIGGRQ